MKDAVISLRLTGDERAELEAARVKARDRYYAADQGYSEYEHRRCRSLGAFLLSAALSDIRRSEDVTQTRRRVCHTKRARFSGSGS